MRAPTLATLQLLGEAPFSLFPLLSGTIFNCVQVSSFECVFAGEPEPLCIGHRWTVLCSKALSYVNRLG